MYVMFHGVGSCFLLLLAVIHFLLLFTLMKRQIIQTVLQMIIKSFSAILAVILEAFGKYCEGDFKLGCG